MNKEFKQRIVSLLHETLKIIKENPPHEETIVKSFKKILIWILREGEFSNIYYSKAADMEFQKINKGSNKQNTLRNYRWRDQTKKSGLNDIKRKIFHYEHFYPISQLRDELLKMKKINHLKIEKIIEKQKIIWITKKEQKLLDNTKNSRNFRNNPTLLFKTKGIEIIY